MPTAINAALTGLAAAGKRLEVASLNIANQQSTGTVQADGQRVNEPYRPLEVVQSSQETGGVLADVRPSERPPEKVYAPDHPDADEQGFLSLPNISLEEQVVQAKLATYDYKANLKTIDVQDNLFENLLDILT